MSPSLMSSTASWPAHCSTTISCGLTTPPSYYTGSKASSTMSYRLTTTPSYCPGLKASSTMPYRLTTAPSYCPGHKASSTMSPSLMSSTASSGQHTVAPPYPADSRELLHIAVASRQAAPC
ncbi:hypothetical protein V3C99_009512, partial [Haemonchus contortus]